MAFWLTQLLNGVSFAALLFLLASGLTLIFGLMRIVNIAHGSYYLLGAYMALTVVQATGNFLAAALAGSLTVAAVGVVMQRAFLARFYRAEQAQVLLTMGFSFVFADLALWIWGGDPRRIPVPQALGGSLPLGPVVFPVYRLVVIGVGVAVAVFLWLLQERTRLGAMVRASVDDQEMARGLGLRVDPVLTGMFAVGAALAGFAGAMGGAFLGVYPGADAEVLPLAFAVVIIGGLGSLKGAVVGSLLVGVLDNLGKALFPELSYFTLFVPMAIVLAIRPTGLFGRV